MKVILEMDTADIASLSTAYKVLNALKGDAGGAAAPSAPAGPPASAPPAAPPPAAPAGPPPAAAPPAAAPAPAAPPPPPAAGGASSAQMVEAVNAFAKAYGPKVAKARFAEASKAFGTTWSKTSDIPPNMYEQALPWFAVAAS